MLKWTDNWLTNRKQRVILNGVTSKWMDVNGGVPQGSVLGPILFVIFINDLDIGLLNSVSKFADDTKIMGRAKSLEDCINIQNDLHKLELWSKQWEMEFNVDKCKVMHIGKNNVRFDYTMFNNSLIETNKEKDLGIIISSDLKVSEQCITACNKANKILGLISRNLDYKTKYTVLSLYTALVRPCLEYAIQFWSPHLQKDIDHLERVQRRATKIIPELRNKTYEQRLNKLNLFSLQKRRRRGDMIETFKMLKGFDRLDIQNLFEMDNVCKTRGHGLKLKKKRFNFDTAKFFFTNRIVDDWNKLPSYVIECGTIESFKKNIDKYYISMNIL